MKNKLIIVIIAAVVVLGAGYVLIRQASNRKTASQQGPKEMMSAEGEETFTGTMPQGSINDNKMMEKTEDKMMQEGAMMEQKPGAYKDYSSSVLAEATKNGGKAVLFFWASWCPYCKEANADFTANTGQIPAGVTVLKTNYDTEKELKTKYGITYQHTFVQVDANGNQITKWNGGGVKELVANIK